MIISAVAILYYFVPFCVAFSACSHRASSLSPFQRLSILVSRRLQPVAHEPELLLGDAALRL